MAKYTSRTQKSNLIAVPVTGGELTRSPICEICGQPAADRAFLADNGLLWLCHLCFTLFGFEGDDGSHK